MYQKNQENMRSSLVSKKFSRPTSSSGDMNVYWIKMLGPQLENMELESDNGLEMKKCTNYLINVNEPWVYFSCHALRWESFLSAKQEIDASI